MNCIWSIDSAPKGGVIIRGLIGVKRYYGMSKDDAIKDYKYQYERKAHEKICTGRENIRGDLL